MVTDDRRNALWIERGEALGRFLLKLFPRRVKSPTPPALVLVDTSTTNGRLSREKPADNDRIPPAAA